MTRDELKTEVHDELLRLERLFEAKNRAYGNDADAFYNFRETARRCLGKEDAASMFKVLLVLMDKHLVALANGGIDTPEAGERLRDVAVYALIGQAMLLEKKQGGGK